MRALQHFSTWWAPRLARWRWAVVALWALAITVSVLSLGGLDKLSREDDGARASSSSRAHAILREKFDVNALTELGLIFEGELPAAYREQLRSALRALPEVASVRPLALPARTPPLALDQVRLDGKLDDAGAVKAAEAIADTLAANPPPAGVTVHTMGRPVIMRELRALNDREIRKIERFSLGVSLLVLLIVFGSLAAALLPVAMGLTSITLTLGTLVALGGLVPVGPMTRLITSVIAIAVGIDYALFVVSRYREERAGGRDPVAAVREALTHTGGALLLSALVMAVSAMALAIPDFSGSRAIAGSVAIVLIISILASFSLLPALLLIADRFLAKPNRWSTGLAAGGRAFWAALARAVLRHYRWVLAGATVAVVVLVGQVSHLKLWEPGPTLLPIESPSRRAFDALSRAGLAGELDALYLVIKQAPGDRTVGDPLVSVISRAEALLKADSRIHRVDSILLASPGHDLGGHREFFAQLDQPIGRMLLLPRLAPMLRRDADGTYTIVRVVPRVSLASPALRLLVKDVQAQILPKLSAPGVEVSLGGNPARRVDFSSEVYGKLPLVVAVTVGAVYLLLLVYFRSVLLPLKAILMNAVPVLGACGVLVLVLQDGWGAGWLGIADPPGAIMAMTPIVLFSLVFGLSMDYEVLILARIKEAHDRGLPDAEAILDGMRSTSGVITGAAAIMLSVFAPNMGSALINAKEFGLGLSAAILLDATVVRLLLVPAAMAAMGRWNWYWPGRTALKIPPGEHTVLPEG